MKTFKLTILFLILIKVNVYSQQNKLERVSRTDNKKPNSHSHYYVFDDRLSKFTGTWTWHYKQKSVKILLLKKGIRFNKQDDDELEILTGSLKYFENNNLVSDYSGDSILQGSIMNKDTLSILIGIKSRNANAALLAIYLPDGSIKLEMDQNRFEFKNDKDFEIKGPIILTKQN